MHRLALRPLVVTFAAVLSFIAATPALAATSSVAVLPLWQASSDEASDDAVRPSGGELTELTTQLQAGLASTPLTIIPRARVTRAASGPCIDARCARRIGEAVGAQVVVFGSVRHITGLVWSTDASAVDVRTGKVLGTLRYSALGDYLVMEKGARELGGCLGRSVAAKPACRTTAQGPTL